MCDIIPDSESFRVYTRLEGNILISSACRYCTGSEILPLVILDAGRLTKNSALRELAQERELITFEMLPFWIWIDF